MTRRASRWCVSVVCLALGACSNVPPMREPRASLKAFGLSEQPQRVVPGVTRIDRPTSKPIDERQIQAQFEGLARLRDEAKLALVELADHANTQVARPVADRELEAFRGRLAQAKGAPFRTIETVPQFLLPEELNLDALRYSAARTRCDLLLLLTRASESYDYNNAWSNLYPTLLGLLVVPGNTLEVRSAVEAALIDVRSGQVLGVVTASRHDSRSLLALAHNRSNMSELAERNAGELFARLADRTLEMARQIR